METLAEIVGKNLSSLRKAKGLTQQQLAEHLNYSDKSISKWELGYALPSVDILKDFAEYYGVSIDSLLSPINEEQIEEVASKKTDRSNINKALILALVNVVVYMIFALVFITYALVRKTPGSLWILFIWGIPACLFVSMIGTRLLYGRVLAVPIIFSCFVWMTILSFCFHFQFASNPKESIWYILVLGIPTQAIIILLMLLKRHR